VVALGEIGLDTFRDYAPLDVQENWFRNQLALADEVGLPVIIHQRSELERVLAMLEEAEPEAGGVLHCFDQDAATVERARKLGFKLGLGGVITYGHPELDDAVRTAPEDMLVLETDAPYLEPEPRSLKRNEPSLLPRVVSRLCELRGWTPQQAVEITRRNSRELFRMPLS
ncbi:MAG TPA: TatD family hydrolase, partial [Verrucomicrobiae bacterium]|nr:TatD family hydrolase [Verrucomicrobiae bacterium]